MDSEIDYKISTITMSIKIPNCNLNIVNIGKYLQIDKYILGLKYNFGNSSILKGSYCTSIYKKSKIKNQNKINKKLFYNQVSIIVNLTAELEESQHRIINVKLFDNGTLHLTGIQDTSEGKKVMLLLYAKLLELSDRHDIVLLTTDINSVYLDNNNNVYSSNDTDEYAKKSIIGFKYKDDLDIYNINKKDFVIDKKTGYFISNKFENKRTKTILNLDGEPIGHSRIELLKNKNKLYKNNSNVNFDYINGYIYYDGDGKSNIIGKIIYEFNDQAQTISENFIKKNIIEYKYSCNPLSNKYSLSELSTFSLTDLKYDINCINIYFKFDFNLNRQRLFNEFIKQKYICEYKPEKYSGVKLRYKLSKNKNNKLGLCTCNNKCTCSNITFLIFQSGNTIAIGFKSIAEIKDILQDFNALINKVKPIIKKKLILPL